MWNFNYITYFQFEFTNSGLSLQTWLGDFNIPARTFVLFAVAVVALRIRKRVRDVLRNRKASQIVETVANVNPFISDWDL